MPADADLHKSCLRSARRQRLLVEAKHRCHGNAVEHDAARNHRDHGLHQQMAALIVQTVCERATQVVNAPDTADAELGCSPESAKRT